LPELVLPDTSVWARTAQPAVADELGDAIDEERVAIVLPVALELLSSARDAADYALLAQDYDALQRVELTPSIERRSREIQAVLAWRGYHRGPSPTDLIAAAAAESVGAELWHCDRHFDLIGEVTGQAIRRVGE
jgi:predicted nucleic acid-binding protein